MALADFTPNRVTVTLKEGVDASVRGLSLNDFGQLLHTHINDLSAVLDIYERSEGSLTQAGLFNFMLKLVSDAPALVAHAIALAADEPTAVNIAQTLGIQKQLELIQIIGQLTVEDFGEVKKLMAGLQTVMQSRPKSQLETGSSPTTKA